MTVSATAVAATSRVSMKRDMLGGWARSEGTFLDLRRTSNFTPLDKHSYLA
jgi:hypothetical protein